MICIGQIVEVLQVARIAFNGNLVWYKCLICGMFKVARTTKVNMPFGCIPTRRLITIWQK
jgi:hypothetical protein